MKAKTTREHFEKYAALAKDFPMSKPELLRALGETQASVIEKLAADEHLNNIPLRKFDGLPHCKAKFTYAWGPANSGYAKFHGGQQISLSENVCTAKHILIYEVAKAEPEFEN